MIENEQNVRKIPFERGLQYLESAGYPRTRVFKYKIFLKLFSDLVESSSLPVTITRKYQQDDLVTADTMLYVMCNQNNCSRKFNVSIVKLIDDYLNYGNCCPKCRLDFKNKQKEIEQKVLERDSQYMDTNPYAGEAFSYEEPELYIKRETVKDKETGLYTTIERTPEEIKAFKQKLAIENQQLIEAFKNDPEAYKRLREKRNKIEGNSRRFRKEAMVEALQNDFDLKLESRGGSSYASGKNDGVSVSNTRLSLEERVVMSGENNSSRNILSDKHYDEHEDVVETHGENIPKDAIWDSIAKEFIEAQGSSFNYLDAGNIYDNNLDFKLDSDL